MESGDSVKSDSRVYLTTSEAAQRLGVSQHRIRSLCRRGQIPDVRKDSRGAWLIPEDTLKQFVEQAHDSWLDRILAQINWLRASTIGRLLFLTFGLITIIATLIGLFVDVPSFLGYFAPSNETAVDSSSINTPTSLTLEERNPPLVPSTAAAEFLVTLEAEPTFIPSFERRPFASGQVFNDYRIEGVSIPNPAAPDSGSLILSHIKIVIGDYIQEIELEDCTHASYSETGRLALVCGGGVYVADAEGRNRIGPIQPLAIVALGDIWAPVWSPDATSIAYIGCRGVYCAVYHQVVGEDAIQVSAEAERNEWGGVDIYSDDSEWISYLRFTSPCALWEAVHITTGTVICVSY